MDIYTNMAHLKLGSLRFVHLLMCGWKSRRWLWPTLFISYHCWPQSLLWLWHHCGPIVYAENCAPMRALTSASGVWWAVYRQSHTATLCHACCLCVSALFHCSPTLCFHYRHACLF